MPGHDADRWVSHEALTKVPADLSGWPEGYQYVFSSTDWRNKSPILVSTYDTWSVRSQGIVKKKAKGCRKSTTYRSCYGDVFGLVVVEEAYELRHSGTKKYSAVEQLRKSKILALPPTPSVNEVSVSLHDLINSMTSSVSGYHESVQNLLENHDDSAREVCGC